MIKIFTARENIDKERFIYENIKGETLVIVPNQYTLVAEEQALKYMGADCLFDTEIISMNRLGLRVLTEQGRESVRMLDKYGRLMLLNRIIKENKDSLDIYANAAGKVSFAQMLSDFISDFKQQNCSIEELREMLAGSGADELLKCKLGELESIVLKYEAAIEGKYTDSEDYIAMYVAAIKESELVRGKDIWIYGYDSITPKFLNAMIELAKRARSLHFIVNCSDFGLEEAVLGQVLSEARASGLPTCVEPIPETYALAKSDTIARIERGLFNDELSQEECSANSDFVPEDLTLVRAANPYYEAESAAAYIYHLVRDLGYRMNEIQIIANDEGVMQPIIRRTFEEYGLPVFLDKSRSITDAAAVSFIVNQLRFVKYKDGTKFLFAMLKTGMAGIDYDSIELLENYARIYKIKGSMWHRPFKYGAEALGEEQLAELENLRQRVITPLTELAEIAGQPTVAEFVSSFRAYLESTCQLSEKVEAAAIRQTEMGLIEEAQRDVQSYIAALELMDQVVEIMGDEPVDLDEFIDIYTTGLAGVEVGVIPPTVDGLSIGTMIRTRPRPAKAVVVLGANEGTLPLQPSTEGLFSVDEKKYFRDNDFAIGKLDDIKINEENAAMYRMLSKPSDKLYISWSMADADGKEATASPLIDSIIELFPQIERQCMIRRDIVSEGWECAAGSDIAPEEQNSGAAALNNLINSPDESMRHLVNHLKDRNTAREMDVQTQAIIAWFENNDKATLDKMLKAAQDENNPPALGASVASGLYSGKGGIFRMSASSIDSYFKCPFKYYVERGLRPREEREFSGDSRSIGDVYHECLMRVAGKILADRPYGRRLVEADDGELERLVAAELDRIAADYNGGLFVSCSNEEFHMERIREICSAAVRAMARQLVADSLSDARFEESFGRGREFRPIELDVNGSKVYVEGKIDRADILTYGDTGAEGETKDRIRIIDYKTGSDKLDVRKMAQGQKIQLMIYMMSSPDNYEPAGMFYFNIKDPIVSFNDEDETRVKRDGTRPGDIKPEDFFKLNGVYIDEAGVLDSMPAEVLGTRGKLSREEFEQLRDNVYNSIEGIANGIVEGNIAIRPFKENNRLVCNYCSYAAICKRDREYRFNAARDISATVKKQSPAVGGGSE